MRASGPGQSLLLLLDVVDLLKIHHVDYAVIGAMAASFHGVVRASLDADAILSMTVQSLTPLQNHFKKAGFKTTLRKGNFEDPIAGVLAVSDVHDNRVDLLVGIKGFDPDAFIRAKSASFQGTKLRMIGLEDFIAMKIFAGGVQDASDAQKAIAVSADSLDRPLLEKLVRRYGKKYEKVLRTYLN